MYDIKFNVGGQGKIEYSDPIEIEQEKEYTVTGGTGSNEVPISFTPTADKNLAEALIENGNVTFAFDESENVTIGSGYSVAKVVYEDKEKGDYVYVVSDNHDLYNLIFSYDTESNQYKAQLNKEGSAVNETTKTYTFTQKYTPQKRSLTVKKVWDDMKDKYPSLMIWRRQDMKFRLKVSAKS